jgi:15-cis-phytoene synthase
VTPDEYCQQKAVQSGSSFYYSFLFLPPDRRRAITALYAYCREVDECTDTQLARVKLAWWREEVGKLYANNPQHPVTRALAPLVSRHSIEQAQMLELIDGMAMDLDYNRYPDFDTLKVYCHRVAGVVGMMSAKIFGYANRATLDYAAKLGLAFQLTNIIRDVGEDARRNRIYLPLDELARFGVIEGDILAARENAKFQKLMAFQIDRALAQYDDAFATLPASDRKPQIPGIIMAGIYRSLLEEIRADGAHVLKQRTSLTPVRKLWIASKTWFKG